MLTTVLQYRRLMCTWMIYVPIVMLSFSLFRPSLPSQYICLCAFFVLHFGLMGESVTIILLSEMAGVLIELKTTL